VNLRRRHSPHVLLQERQLLPSSYCIHTHGDRQSKSSRVNKEEETKPIQHDCEILVQPLNDENTGVDLPSNTVIRRGSMSTESTTSTNISRIGSVSSFFLSSSSHGQHLHPYPNFAGTVRMSMTSSEATESPLIVPRRRSSNGSGISSSGTPSSMYRKKQTIRRDLPAVYTTRCPQQQEETELVDEDNVSTTSSGSTSSSSTSSTTSMGYSRQEQVVISVHTPSVSRKTKSRSWSSNHFVDIDTGTSPKNRKDDDDEEEGQYNDEGKAKLPMYIINSITDSSVSNRRESSLSLPCKPVRRQSLVSSISE